MLTRMVKWTLIVYGVLALWPMRRCPYCAGWRWAWDMPAHVATETGEFLQEAFRSKAEHWAPITFCKGCNASSRTCNQKLWDQQKKCCPDCTHENKQ